jgi:hypothetical protein
MFGNDRVLLYDVEPWNRYGFGVPNFGENVGSLNKPIVNLVDEIGAAQLFVMTHVDAQRKQPPSINTVKRLGKVCNRIKSVLSGRQKLANQDRLEPGHATPDTAIFNIHPVPYFASGILRNHWLREYNSLCMMALANMMQHSDNNLALTITSKFAQDNWQYFREIASLVGTELLGIPRADVDKDEFVFTDAHYETYNPESVTLNFEGLDEPGPLFSLATEDDLRPLFRGIPATLIMPVLKQYPVGPIPGADGLAGVDLPSAYSAVGVPGATGPATIGAGQPGAAPSGSMGSVGTISPPPV